MNVVVKSWRCPWVARHRNNSQFESAQGKQWFARETVVGIILGSKHIGMGNTHKLSEIYTFYFNYLKSLSYSFG